MIHSVSRNERFAKLWSSPVRRNLSNGFSTLYQRFWTCSVSLYHRSVVCLSECLGALRFRNLCSWKRAMLESRAKAIGKQNTIFHSCARQQELIRKNQQAIVVALLNEGKRANSTTAFGYAASASWIISVHWLLIGSIGLLLNAFLSLSWRDLRTARRLPLIQWCASASERRVFSTPNHLQHDTAGKKDTKSQYKELLVFCLAVTRFKP